MKKKTGLQINCDVCKKLIEKQGALLFSPPEYGACCKYHICCKCYGVLYEQLRLTTVLR